MGCADHMQVSRHVSELARKSRRLQAFWKTRVGSYGLQKLCGLYRSCGLCLPRVERFDGKSAHNKVSEDTFEDDACQEFLSFKRGDCRNKSAHTRQVETSCLLYTGLWIVCVLQDCRSGRIEFALRPSHSVHIRRRAHVSYLLACRGCSLLCQEHQEFSELSVTCSYKKYDYCMKYLV